METLTIYKHEAKKYPLLTADKEKELAVKAQAGDDDARDELVCSNLRLVISMAQKYQGRGLDIEDLVSEGNLGLIRAVDSFKPEMDLRFSTYAVNWILQRIGRAIHNQVGTIRVPVHMSEAVGRMKNSMKQLSQELGRTATNAEVATAMGVEEDKIEEMILSSGGVLSLDNVVGDEDDMTFADMVKGHDETPEEAVLGGLERGRVQELIRALKDDKAEAVIKFRYGFDENDPHTLEEIGKKMSLTRERVRQIEKEALGKLREELAA